MNDDDRMGTSTPRPDPTVLTTEALQREVAAMKELLTHRLESAERISDSEHSMLRQSIQDQKELREKELEALHREFALAERSRVEQKADTQSSYEAALRNTREVSEQQTRTFSVALEGVSASINEAKERLSKVEQQQATTLGQGQGKQQSWGLIVSIVALAGGVIGIFVYLLTLVAK